jgi:hypothetical protein
MKKNRFYAISMILIGLMLTSTFAVFKVYSQQYIKPSFPDYAPNGMPDFDEKQDQWGPGQGVFTWCVPVAVANSLWWLDSEYESKYFPSPLPPPTISDHYSLVTAYNQWDDHDAQNVDPFVRNLAFLMDTDGQRTGIGHIGTRWIDVQPGIQAYLIQQGVNGSFEVHGADFPNFNWIDTQVRLCQDVELFLEFWYFAPQGWQPITYPSFESGHCVTCAGSDNITNQVLVSDPFFDISNPAVANHNDAQFVSHDPYTTVQFVFPPNPMPPPPYLAPPGYPPAALELANYLQTVGFSQDPNWHTFIRGAVATSPVPTHDVAVTSVTTSKTGCTPMPTIGQNFNLTVNVTVANIGNFDESLVSITAYATPTPPPSITIGTKTVSLNAGASITVTFVWNATGSYGNYTISATAGPVAGETNIGDNTLSDGTALVTIPGDINGDFKVSLQDLVILALAYSTRPGDAKWNPNSDIDSNGAVGLTDLVILALHYGQHYP